jgi:hypothetical protein
MISGGVAPMALHIIAITSAFLLPARGVAGFPFLAVFAPLVALLAFAPVVALAFFAAAFFFAVVRSAFGLISPLVATPAPSTVMLGQPPRGASGASIVFPFFVMAFAVWVLVVFVIDDIHHSLAPAKQAILSPFFSSGVHRLSIASVDYAGFLA